MQLHEQKTRQLVCIWDPAIDTEASDLSEYIRTRDAKHLQYVAGTKPEIYHCRAITHDMFSWVNAPEKPEDKFARAFYASVVKVSNFVDAQHNQRDEWAPAAVQNAGAKLDRTVDLFSKDEKAKFDPGTYCEIGEVMYRLAFFPKRIAVSFQLSPMSLQIWQMAAVQRAEQAASTPATGTNEPTPAEAPPEAA